MAPQVVLVIADEGVVEIVHAEVHALAIVAVGAVVVDMGVALQPGTRGGGAAVQVDAPVVRDVGPEQMIGATVEPVRRARHLGVLALPVDFPKTVVLGMDGVDDTLFPTRTFAVTGHGGSR